MRTLYLTLTAVLSINAAADDRYVCTPSAEGKDWACAEDVNAKERRVLLARAAESTPTSTSSPAAPGHALDWVERVDLPAARLAEMPAYCKGSYVEPAYPLPRDADSTAQPIAVSARAAEYWQGDRAELTGGVEVRQGNVSLAADEATYHESSGEVAVTGNVTLRQPGLLVHGNAAEVAVRTGAAEVRDVEFVIHDARMRGTAQALRVDDNGTLAVDSGSFTTCEPGDQSWSINSRTVVIERDANHGVARNAVLRAGKVPLLYTPYIRFPVTDERLSGFLFPDVGYGDDDGLDVGLPYYLNLAPNYDATVTPRYISERGVGGEVEMRYLSKSSYTELGGAYLVDDDSYNGDLSRDDFDDLGLPGGFDPADRWLATAEHAGRFGDLGTSVSYAKVSDDDYFRDLGTNLSVTSTIDLEQRAELNYGIGALQLRLWAQDFQNLDPLGTDAYRRLPELSVHYDGRIAGPLQWSLQASSAAFDRDDTGFAGIDRIDGRRHHIEPRVEVPLSWALGFLRLGGGYRYTRYDLNDVPAGADDRPDRRIWLGQADGGLFFERETSWFGESLLQTLEPRVFYLYQEREDQTALPLFDAIDLDFSFSQLFRDNRFSGLDRIGDANQMSVGVTTRFLERDTGIERLRASVGQIRYFEEREVTLRDVQTARDRRSNSAMAGEIAMQLMTGVSLTSTLVWSPQGNEWQEVGAHLQFRGTGRGIFNVGYRGRRDEAPRLDQVDLSFHWPAWRNWSLMSRWNYDVEERRVLEAFGGVEYNNCCWQARVLARRFVSSADEALGFEPQTDDGIFLQIVFKGLAGIGGRIDALMENGIRGYRPEEY